MITDNAKEIANAQKEYLKQETKAYKEYIKDRQAQLAEIAKLEATNYRADADAQEERQEIIADAQRTEQERLEDHQKTMRRMREDHEDKLFDLVASRDARAILEEQRDYRKRRTREEEDFQDEGRRNQENLDEQLAQHEEQWKEQHEEELEQLRQRLKDLDENYKEQQIMRQEEFDERMAEMSEQHDEELAEFDQAQRDKLATLLGYNQETEDAQAESYNRRYIALMEFLQQEYNLTAEHFQRLMELYNTPIPSRWEVTYPWSGESYHTPGRQMGGSIPETGLYKLHRREFVVNAPTVTAIERGGYGPLTQQKAAAALGGGIGRLELSGRAVIEIGGNLGEQLTPGQKEQITGVVCDVLVQTLAPAA
jgi:hypothetical protein